MIKSGGIRLFLSLFILLLVSSCATVKESLGPGDLRLTGVEFPEFGGIRKNLKYPVEIKFEADGRPEIPRACIYWGTDGPYCLNLMDVNYGTQIARVDTPIPPREGMYRFRVFVYYVRDGRNIRSNITDATVTVIP